jgi:hypothetical protein
MAGHRYISGKTEFLICPPVVAMFSPGLSLTLSAPLPINELTMLNVRWRGREPGVRKKPFMAVQQTLSDHDKKLSLT